MSVIDRIGDYIQLYSGGRLYPFDPRLEEIHIEDIAHALSRIPRFTGHTRGDFPLSVAQHSVMVSYHCDPSEALEGLLHDGSDMAFGDIARPLKYMTEYVPIRTAETLFQDAVYRRFGCRIGKLPSVHSADNRVLAAEVRDLMTWDEDIWGKWLYEWEPVPDRVEPLAPEAAKKMFLDRFHELYEGM